MRTTAPISLFPEPDRQETRPMRRKSGFTLVEMIIAVLIFSLISGGLYGFLTHARKQSARADIRMALTTQSNTILQVVQEDLKFTASASIAIDQNAGQVRFEQHVGKDLEDVAKVSYLWQKPKLFRKAVYKGKTTLKMMSKCVDLFQLERKPRPSIAEDDFDAQPEQVKVSLGLSLWVPGFKDPMTHEQHVMATMRELSSRKYDPHWRDVGNMKGAFSTYGNLLSSLGEDAKLLVEDITSTIDDIVAKIENDIKDAMNKPKANLEDAKNQLRNALSEITQARLDVDSSLADMDIQIGELPSKIFNRDSLSNLFASKDDAMKRVRDAYRNMKELGQMDYGKLKKAADPFDLDSCFEEFFNNKVKALENRVQLDEKKKDVADLLAKIEEQGYDGNRD